MLVNHDVTYDFVLQLGARMKADADGAVSELCAVMTSVRLKYIFLRPVAQYGHLTCVTTNNL